MELRTGSLSNNRSYSTIFPDHDGHNDDHCAHSMVPSSLFEGLAAGRGSPFTPYHILYYVVYGVPSSGERLIETLACAPGTSL